MTFTIAPSKIDSIVGVRAIIPWQMCRCSTSCTQQHERATTIKKRTLHPSLRSGAAWLVAFSGKGKDTYIYIYIQ